MIQLFDFARSLGFIGVLSRLVVALICGGIIGLEREYKHRPAGFRTHILICIGASVTTLTSQFLYLKLHMYTDVARLGAQVIAGIGFIGAGTIIVTNRKRVKGLTTAAGLWTSAIIGLVCGAGYIEGAIVATCLVLLAELLLVKIEYRYARSITDISLYIEYTDASCIEQVVKCIRDERMRMTDLEITRTTEPDEMLRRYCAVVTIQADKAKLEHGLIKEITALDSVISIEEL